MERRTIADIQPGESAWTLPWALHEAQGQCWLNPDYPAYDYDHPVGTVQMRVKRSSRGRRGYLTWSPKRGYVTPAGLAHWGGPTSLFQDLHEQIADLGGDAAQLFRDAAQARRRCSTLAMAMTDRHLRRWRAAIVLMSTLAAVSGYVFTQADTTVGAAASLIGLFAGCVSAAVCLKFRSDTLDQLVRDMELWGEAHDQSSAASP